MLGTRSLHYWVGWHCWWHWIDAFFRSLSSDGVSSWKRKLSEYSRFPCPYPGQQRRAKDQTSSGRLKISSTPVNIFFFNHHRIPFEHWEALVYPLILSSVVVNYHVLKEQRTKFQHSAMCTRIKLFLSTMLAQFTACPLFYTNKKWPSLSESDCNCRKWVLIYKFENHFFVSMFSQKWYWKSGVS